MNDDAWAFATTTRRSFLRAGLILLGSVHGAGGNLEAFAVHRTSFKGKDVFDRLVAKAVRGDWRQLPIGELMGLIAKELEGTLYKAGTLDTFTDVEVCSIDLTGLDCVTFCESVLDFARMLKQGGDTTIAFSKEVRFTRYRNGRQGDYSSRLHYTTEWFLDNEKKGVVQLLSHLPGSEPFTQKVGFMTSHPKSYPQIAAHPQLLRKLRRHENAINRVKLTFVPLEKIAAAEPLLKTGDIVGVCTSVAGLDIAHTGLVIRDKNGIARFMDASSAARNMKVTIESGPISEALHWSKSLTGAIFARPLEPHRS